MAKHLIILAVLLVSCLQTVLAGTVQLNGFGTIGVAQSDQNSVQMQRDLSSIYGVGDSSDPFVADSRVGVQLDWEITQKLSFVLQEVYAPRVLQNINNNIQWATFRFDASKNWRIRFGRIGADSFAVTDQRNVGFSYLWVRPPTEVYAFMPLYSMDGVDVRYSFSVGADEVQLKLVAAKSNPTYFLTSNILTTNTDLNLSPVFGGTITYLTSAWTARLSFLRVTERSPLPGLNSELNIATQLSAVYPAFTNISELAQVQNTDMYFEGASIQYDDGKTVLLSEITANQFDSRFKQNKIAGYVTIGEHYGKYTPYISFSKVAPTRSLTNINTTSIPAGPVQYLASEFNSSYFDTMVEKQQTYSIGVRRELTSKSDIKIQYDCVKVFGNGYEDWLTNSATPRQSGVNMISATIDWMF